MKYALFLLLFFAPFFCSAQIVNNGSGTFVWVNTPPTHNPGASGAKFAVDKNTFIWYEWVSGTTWVASGERVQSIGGCAAPAYTPGKNQSKIVLNNCATPQLFAWSESGEEWVEITAIKTVDAVLDSAAFRAYAGRSEVVIMQDTLRGGTFAYCNACTPDGYMVFQTAAGIKYRRINYDRILESWFGRWGHRSLQAAINFAYNSQMILTHNQPLTLKDSVFVWEGVQIEGVSPTNLPGTNPLDTRAVNFITLDLNNTAKAGFVFEANPRGYAENTRVRKLAIRAVSPCRTALSITKPNRCDLDDILISGNATSRYIKNGIEIAATVYSNFNNVRVFGCQTGIKELEAAFSGGTLSITGTSSVVRCSIGIDMEFGGAFFANGLHLENIDSIGIKAGTFYWTGGYTENVPLAANGTVIQTINGDALVNVFGVQFNGGANCITGDCAVFRGGGRSVILRDNWYFNVNKIVGDANDTYPKFGVVTGGTHYNVEVFTQNLQKLDNWKAGEIPPYSGGTVDTMLNWYPGRHLFKTFADYNKSTGQPGQVLQAQTGETMLWDYVAPSKLKPDGANEGDVLLFDGETWIPGAPPTAIPSGAAGELVRYNGTNSVQGESNLFWDAINSRFGVGTTSPTRRLTIRDAANSYLRVEGENNGGVELAISNANPNCAWDSYASRGNLTTPTATNAGNTLGQFRFYGHTGSAYRQAATIAVRTTVNGSVGGGVPTDMVFSTTRTGFAGVTERLWLKNRGYFSVGTKTPSGYFTVKSDDSGVPITRFISSAGDSTGIYVRSTTPEGAQAAPPGTLSILTDGSLFSKLSGTGNTGWSEFVNRGRAYGATNGQVLAWNGTIWTPTTVSASPAGSTGQIQFNNAGAFGASANFTVGSESMNISGGLPYLNFNSTSNFAGYGVTYSFNSAGRFRFLYQENVNRFFLQGSDGSGNFTVNPGLSINRGANNNVGINVAVGTSPAQQLHVNGAMRLTGNAGTPITLMGRDANGDIAAMSFKTTVTLDFPSTGAHSSSDLAATVTGAVVGDQVFITPLANAPANSFFSGVVTATNTVIFRFNHYGNSGAVDPASQNFNVTILK